MKTNKVKHIWWTKNCPSVKKGKGKPKMVKKKLYHKVDWRMVRNVNPICLEEISSLCSLYDVHTTKISNPTKKL